LTIADGRVVPLHGRRSSPKGRYCGWVDVNMVGLALQWLQLSGQTCGAQRKGNEHHRSPLIWLII
jgi:hypothetical protein